MNIENKQRVIGIIVLVAFIALLIPFLFTTGIKKRHDLVEEAVPLDPISEALNEVADAKPSTPMFIQGVVEDEEVTTEKVDMDSQPQDFISETQSTIPVQQVTQDVSSDDKLPSSLVVEEVSSKVSVDSASGDVFHETQSITVESEPVAKPVEPKKPIIKSMAKPKKKAVAPKKSSVKKKSIAKSLSSTYWSVQVGSFLDQARAQRMVDRLQDQGFNVYLQKITTASGTMVRVLVGREDSKIEAKEIAEQLKTKLNVDGYVVGKK